MATVKELLSDKYKFKSEPARYVEAVNLLGHKYQELGRYDEAVVEHREAIVASKRIKSSLSSCRSEAISRRALGECFCEMSKYVEAKAEHDAYLNLAKSLEDAVEIQRAHATIGRTYLLWAIDESNQHDLLFKAARSFMEALRLCEALISQGKIKNREYVEMKSRLLLNLGLVYESLSDLDKCKKQLFEAIELTKTNFLFEDLYRCQISLAAVYDRASQHYDAKQMYQEALEVANKLKSKTKRVEAMLGLGLALIKLEDIETARSHFKRAYHIRTAVEENRRKAERLLKVASIIRDDLRKVAQCKSDELIALFDRLGDHFVELKCYSQAVKYYQLELNQAKAANRPAAFLAKVYISIGQTYCDDGQYGDAIEYFTKEYQVQQNRAERCTSLLKIAEVQEYALAEMDDLDVDERRQMKEDIRSSYEKALGLFERGDDENAAANSNSKETKCYVQAIKNYTSFLATHKEDAGRLKELREKLQELCGPDRTIELSDEEEEEEEEGAETETAKLYEQYDLDLVSDPSEFEESDDEEVPGGVVLPVGKKRNPNAAKLNRLNQFGETPLHTACIAGNIAAVERLVEQKAPLNAKDYCGWTPLHEACNHGHLEVVECLLKAGAFVDSADDRSDRLTPLHDACDNGHLNIARLLLRYDANLLALNVDRETPVERLMSWRRRTELDEAETAACLQLEKEMMERMAASGFDLDALRRKVAGKVGGSGRSKGNSSQASNRSQARGQSDASRRQRNLTGEDIYLKKGLSKTTITSRLEPDDPGFGRLEYQTTMDKLRRGNGHLPPRLAKLGARTESEAGAKTAALVEESEAPPRDDWLIDDLGLAGKNTKRRVNREESVTTAYGPRQKKQRASLEHSGSKHSVQPLYDLDDSSDMDDDSSIGDYAVPEFDRANLTTTIEPANENTDSEPNFDQPARVKSREPSEGSCMRLVVVQFDDADRSSFAIPLPLSGQVAHPPLTFQWLIDELSKRYLRKYFVRPVIALHTTEGAMLSEEDRLSDIVAAGGTHTFRATITAYRTEDPAKRYRELCAENNADTVAELAGVLTDLQVDGTFCVANSFFGCQQQSVFVLQSLYRQNVREINVSWSNVLVSHTSLEALFSALSTLSSLQVLNLSGCAFPRKCLIRLFNLSPALRILDLSFNSLGDKQAFAIAQIINSYDRLQQLSLVACDLSMTFLRNSQVIEAIEGTSRLQSVELDYNRDIEASLVAQFKTLGSSKLFLKAVKSR